MPTAVPSPAPAAAGQPDSGASTPGRPFIGLSRGPAVLNPDGSLKDDAFRVDYVRAFDPEGGL